MFSIANVIIIVTFLNIFTHVQHHQKLLAICSPQLTKIKIVLFFFSFNIKRFTALVYMV